MTNHSASGHIRTLIIVMGGAILLALSLSIGMLYYYNPPGSYLAGNMLLDPNLLPSLRFSEAIKRGGDQTPFVFSGIEYTYYDQDLKKWNVISVDLNRYQILYHLIAMERSYVEISDQIKNSFLAPPPSTLSIKVRRANTIDTTSELLKIDFATDGDVYRISLRNDTAKNENFEPFVYFYHRNIKEKAQEIVIGRGVSHDK